MRSVLVQLRNARDAATMVRCSLDPDFDKVATPYTDEVRKQTRLYRETWIISPLDDVIAALEKELAK